jgi:recombination protein RecA
MKKESSQINQDSDRVRRRVGSRTPKSLCENSLDQVLRATDLLLESGGFGLIALDLGDVPPQAARHIPLTTWFRFRRAIEYTPTILLAIEQRPIAGSCSSLLLQLGSRGRSRQRMDAPFAEPAHAQLFTGLDISTELIRSRLERKPACSTAAFASTTAWAG